jgi:hypothetical protein
MVAAIDACGVQRATTGQEVAQTPIYSAESSARESENNSVPQPSPDRNFYADTNRGAPLEVAFFYSGVEGNKYTLSFGDGTSALLTFHHTTDCFPRLQGKSSACPNYWGFHTYSAPGTYLPFVRDPSGKTLNTLTIQVR